MYEMRSNISWCGRRDKFLLRMVSRAAHKIEITSAGLVIGWQQRWLVYGMFVALGVGQQ